jgi:hypothetical protein
MTLRKISIPKSLGLIAAPGGRKLQESQEAIEYRDKRAARPVQ